MRRTALFLLLAVALATAVLLFRRTDGPPAPGASPAPAAARSLEDSAAPAPELLAADPDRRLLPPGGDPPPGAAVSPAGGPRAGVSGRVLYAALEPAWLTVRLAHTGEQAAAKFRAGAFREQRAAWIARLDAEVDWPVQEVWFRGPAGAVEEDGRFEVRVPVRAKLRGQRWRAEIWYAPPAAGGETRAREPSLPVAFSRSFDLEAGSRHRTEDLAAPPLIELRLRLEREGRQELPGGQAGREAPVLWSLAWGAPGPAPLRERMSGDWPADGRLHWWLPGALDGYRGQITAWHTGLQVSTGEFRLGPGENDLGSLRLPVPALLSGIVRDARTRAAVEGQDLRLVRLGRLPAPWDGRPGGLAGTAPVSPALRTRSRAGGRFVFPPVAPGRYRISTLLRPAASGPGQVPARQWTASAATLERELELLPGERRELELEVGTGLVLLRGSLEGLPGGTHFLAADYAGPQGGHDQTLLRDAEFAFEVPADRAVTLRAWPVDTPGDPAGPLRFYAGRWEPGQAPQLVLRPYPTRWDLPLPDGLTRGSLRLERLAGSSAHAPAGRPLVLTLPRVSGASLALEGLQPGRWRATLYDSGTVRDTWEQEVR